MIYLKEKQKQQKKKTPIINTYNFFFPYLFCWLCCIWTYISLITKIMLLVFVPALFGHHLPLFILHPDIPCEE